MFERATELTIFPPVRSSNDESGIHANCNTYGCYSQACYVTGQVRRWLGLGITEVWQDTWRRLQAGSFEQLLQRSHCCITVGNSRGKEHKLWKVKVQEVGNAWGTADGSWERQSDNNRSWNWESKCQRMVSDGWQSNQILAFLPEYEIEKLYPTFRYAVGPFWRHCCDSKCPSPHCIAWHSQRCISVMIDEGNMIIPGYDWIMRENGRR